MHVCEGERIEKREAPSYFSRETDGRADVTAQSLSLSLSLSHSLSPSFRIRIHVLACGSRATVGIYARSRIMQSVTCHEAAGDHIFINARARTCIHIYMHQERGERWRPLKADDWPVERVFYSDWVLPGALFARCLLSPREYDVWWRLFSVGIYMTTMRASLAATICLAFVVAAEIFRIVCLRLVFFLYSDIVRNKISMCKKLC